ncbi:mercuric transporter MerT family protein [Chelativorans alearense]|uniref:mercuric transporter MerT family protein n=1 Tax=Chelativorans alearense TaxID=2681495 RepID=UPI001FE5689D|nr:mercuric transporter MerT family protein [Chelativorans alearense]
MMNDAHDASLDPARGIDGGESAVRGSKLAAVGGILGAIAASSCCVLPFALFMFGVSGAWIGNLTALEPYQPYFIAMTLAFLGYGYYAVYWKAKKACAEGSYCATPRSTRIARIGLWTATVLVTIAYAFPRLAVYFL